MTRFTAVPERAHGRSLGICPLVTWAGILSSTPVSAALRWVNAFDVSNRPKGNAVELSLSATFQQFGVVRKTVRYSRSIVEEFQSEVDRPQTTGFRLLSIDLSRAQASLRLDASAMATSRPELPGD
jgi:hypothetical protein